MSIIESYNGAAQKARTATERSVDIWKLGAKTIIGPVDLVSNLPSVDLTWPVRRYFDYAQQAVDLNRELATAWAETVMSLFGVVREHAEKVSRIVTDEAETVADLAREQADEIEQAARQQAEQAEQAERDQARRARQAEREQARQARERARQRYEGLTKAELSDKLAERELPKTGTVDELIERLVSADSQ